MSEFLVVCSPGGHFDEARAIVVVFQSSQFKFVVHDLKAPPEIENILQAPNANRNLGIILQFAFAIRCILRERPKAILSTGSSIAVPFFIIAKLFRIKTIYVESPTRVHTPSLTGKIVQHLSDKLFVRYKTLQPKLKNSIFIDP
jgi:UDP-N-acetylglucosamine:LPS N-acetylglucosamine transferase